MGYCEILLQGAFSSKDFSRYRKDGKLQPASIDS
ncbi:hypothetical protein T10_2791 [Trichinella papuae]|uniref:Uncharacterized protein n=1 Tax=Trichinella papuae TaxID=268474 RepID=A0A0V1LY16_9BILA|nr:hypothetical protein T10_2791 [Trichinella papuae]